ncbi:MAG TPA: hypothetical protein VME70_11665 [Mycobacteriales bacterium]|nr:hypothetical protein [Mycobacteriales bacterium]
MADESMDRTEVVSLDSLRDDPYDDPRRDRDGVGSLHDAEAEAGDEEELDDRFDLDRDEARELGVELDRTGGETPTLD